MASIYKRGKIWWIHYLIGKQSVSRSLKTTSHRVALEKKKKFEALDVLGHLEAPSNTKLVDILQSFCEFLLQSRSKKSAKNDISYLRTFFGPCCPALEFGSRVPHKFRKKATSLPKVPDKLKNRHIPVTRLEQISSEMINNFIQQRIKHDNISAKTANRTREILHRLFSYAVEHYGYICPDRRYQNPVKGVKRAKEPAPQVRFLSKKQIKTQLEILNDAPTLHAMVATYIYAGLRREEALWLTTKDVDLEKRLIRVNAKTIDEETWQPKTKSNRIIPISNDLYSILVKYGMDKHHKWFFPSPNGQRWDPDNFSRKLRKINKANGLKWSCLDFRHTFGSHLAQKGVSLYRACPQQLIS
jgi:integrase